MHANFEKHNHQNCIADALKTAKNHCAENGLQLTKLRRRVLEILLSDHRAFGAYEVLETLHAEGLGKHPPIAYRALDFWVAQGFAHKIMRLNRFLACHHPQQKHAPAFLLCRACEQVNEIDIPQNLDIGVDFAVEARTIEVEGLCPNCLKDVHADRT